jgi:hypothetical protein
MVVMLLGGCVVQHSVIMFISWGLESYIAKDHELHVWGLKVNGRE